MKMSDQVKVERFEGNLNLNAGKDGAHRKKRKRKAKAGM